MEPKIKTDKERQLVKGKPTSGNGYGDARSRDSIVSFYL